MADTVEWWQERALRAEDALLEERHEVLSLRTEVERLRRDLADTEEALDRTTARWKASVEREALHNQEIES